MGDTLGSIEEWKSVDFGADGLRSEGGATDGSRRKIEWASGGGGRTGGEETLRRRICFWLPNYQPSCDWSVYFAEIIFGQRYEFFFIEYTEKDGIYEEYLLVLIKNRYTLQKYFMFFKNDIKYFSKDVIF